MKTTNQFKQAFLLFAGALIATQALQAQSVNGWRGPERSGVYPDKGLLASWPEGGPQLLWEIADAGKGYSSPVIVGDRLYVTGMNETGDKEIFSAYNVSDGQKIYQIAYGSPWNKSYPETRTTPTIEGNKAYVISGSGDVVCINIANGDIVWSVNGGETFQRKTGIWGTSESPLVYDNKVIYSPAGDQTTVVALNAQTGEVVWKSKPLGNNSSYVSPLLITHNGKKQIVGITGKNVIGVDPADGEIKWTFGDWGKEDGEKIAANTPLFKDGRIFVCNGYDMGSFMLKLNDDASAVTLEWRNNDLDTHIGGFVLQNGVIYGSNWMNNNQGNWMAVDWNTGETKYNTAWEGKSKGSIIAADNMLYCYDERRGTVALVKPNPEKFEVVSEFRIAKGDGPHWAHPVINNGVLYVRHGNALMAFKIK